MDCRNLLCAFFSSFPRRRESSFAFRLKENWVPAYAGTTSKFADDLKEYDTKREVDYAL